MSPGTTMLRVYETLKARIMAGEFLPGERLDPGRLASGLVASRTPVRDALLKLSGERLVDSWEQEGFRVPVINEPAIRDLYDWTTDVLHVVIRAASRRPATSDRCPPAPQSDYVRAVAGCFHAVASLSPNHEHRAIVTSLNDRSTVVRRAEAIVVVDAEQDIMAVEAAMTRGDWSAVGRAVDHFHRRRLRLVAEIAASLRPRDALRS